MRRLINLVEFTQDRRRDFLEIVNLWASEMTNNDYESNKPQLEAELFQFEDLCADYRYVRGSRLYRGTGLSRKELAAIQSGQTINIDMTESQLSSWSASPGVAEAFVNRYFKHFEGDCAIVATYPISSGDVFLSIPALWASMSQAERKEFDGIEIAMREQEVIIRHSLQFPMTKDNIYSVHDRSEYEDEDDEFDDEFDDPEDEEGEEDNQYAALQAKVAALSPAVARASLRNEALKRHPGSEEQIDRRIASLSDAEVKDFLVNYLSRN
jgi:hypothetical protein